MEANYFTILWVLPYIDMNQPLVYMCPLSRNPAHLPPHPIPLGCPCASALNALFHALNLDWSSKAHMVIYMFQCYSLKSPHPHLCPQNPKDCSIHLCLFCCLASSGHSLFFSKGFSLSLNHRMWNFFSNLKLTLF